MPLRPSRALREVISRGSDCSKDAAEGGLGMLFEGTFPDAEDPPAGALEGAVHEFVPLQVDGKFALPKGAVVFGIGGVSGAAMPEAAVHEDGEFEPGEDEVGTDGK